MLKSFVRRAALQPLGKHPRFQSKRLSSGTANFLLSEEVADALGTKKPVVALESTIVTHGLPYPTNVRMAASVEKIIRSAGAVPATTAFLNGAARVGLSPEEMEVLASSANPQKVSRRDIPNVIANKLNGGTTIAGTMILAHRAGIRVFATGGLGGVHRGVADHWDISADLEELGHTPVAVVCSGPKSILDVPKTLEYLETKGCYVSTYSPSGRDVNVPGFFTRDSGVPSPFRFVNPRDAARVIFSGSKFGLNSGYVFCVPASPEFALDQDVVNGAIEYALAEATAQGITGKDTTPFLLKKVWEATGGDSVKTNVEFVKENARMAAQIAKEYCLLPEQSLQEPLSSSSTSAPGWITPGSASAASAAAASPDAASSPSKPAVARKPKRTLMEAPKTKPLVAAVGALSQDITCTLSVTEVSVSSYPGRISTSLGGTAHNVALASAYSGAPTRLISCIGDREEGDIAKAVSPALDVSGVRVSGKVRTPRYVSTNDAKGELIVACADMDAITNLDPAFIRDQLLYSRPEICVFDGNLGAEQTREVLKAKELNNNDPLIVFEPTSVPKAARIADVPDLGVFPNASIDIATPNYLELMSMFEEFSFRERFNVDRWFPVIDGLPLSDMASRMKLDIFSRSNPSLANVVQSGLIQASLQLLPYIPNLFVTMGQDGVLSFQLIEHLKDRTGGTVDGPNSVYILSRSREYGVLIQHFPIEHEVLPEDAKSVNGIGDTFCGSLVAQLAKSRMWLRDDGLTKKEAVLRAMEAASLSLQTYQAVNSEIADLFTE